MGNFSKTVNNIDYIQNEVEILNTFICGNKTEIENYKKKEITKDIGEDDEFNVSEYIHPKNKNIFIKFYYEEINEELIKSIFNRLKMKYGGKNNLILILFKNQDEKEIIKLIKVILDNLLIMPIVYKPIIIFAKKIANENYDEDIESEECRYRINILNIYKNDYDKNIINKYIDFVIYKENDYIKVNKKINSVFCYYNNISDIISILDEMLTNKNTQLNRINKIKHKACLNILVLGRPGTGKSTLINLLLNKRKAKEGIGLSITRKISKYIHNKYPISFQDTPGFENKEDLNKLYKYLKDTNHFFKEGKNKIHLILYLINASNERTFNNEEVELIKYINSKLEIPIFFVCTKCKNLDYAKDFEETIKLSFWQNFGEETNLVKNIYYCHLINEKDGIYKRFGIDKLLDSIQKKFENEINRNNENNTFICLTKYENFQEYLFKLTNEIIENYSFLTYKNEEAKNEHSKIKNKKYNDYEPDKINELLIDNLAFELNSETTGKIFCKLYLDEIKEQVNLEIEREREEKKSCNLFSQSNDISIKNIKIKDLEIKKYVNITKTIGLKARNDFLNDFYDDNNYKNYFKSLIDTYKYALESLPNLVKEME